MDDIHEKETNDPRVQGIEELKLPQEYVDGITILDDIHEKETNDPRVQGMFKRSRHNNLSIFLISQDYYDLAKRTIRAKGNIYHIFKPNNFRVVQNLYQDNASVDMTLSEFQNLTNAGWNEKYQPITIDMTKDNFTGRYRVGINSTFVQDSSSF